jgi:hypothetical protein
MDFQSNFWANLKILGQPCEFQVGGDAAHEVLVSVYDPSDSGPQPQGKQRVGSIAKPGGDHYTPSSGIWQTVWMETVPPAAIEKVRQSPAQLRLSARVVSARLCGRHRVWRGATAH